MRLLPLAAFLLLAPPAASAANPVVRFTTLLGNYDVELCAEPSPACPGVAPATVANFLRYVDEDRYGPGGFIHRRATSPAVLQGGGYQIVGEPPTMLATEAFDPIPLELGPGLAHVRGTIAMARGPQVDSARSQWFVNLADNDDLNGDYAVFGAVVAGLDVVDALGAVPVHTDFCSIVTLHLCELPLIDWPGEPAEEFPFDHLVYVTSVERVPEAGPAGGLAALAALAALARRGRGPVGKSG
jgi:cyclophilin family peptidyl-prolyl cis-trans isomerase